jgi:hypothetical protein
MLSLYDSSLKIIKKNMKHNHKRLFAALGILILVIAGLSAANISKSLKGQFIPLGNQAKDKLSFEEMRGSHYDSLYSCEFENCKDEFTTDWNNDRVIPDKEEDTKEYEYTGENTYLEYGSGKICSGEDEDCQVRVHGGYKGENLLDALDASEVVTSNPEDDEATLAESSDTISTFSPKTGETTTHNIKTLPPNTTLNEDGLSSTFTEMTHFQTENCDEASAQRSEGRSNFFRDSDYGVTLQPVGGVFAAPWSTWAFVCFGVIPGTDSLSFAVENDSTQNITNVFISHFTQGEGQYPRQPMALTWYSNSQGETITQRQFELNLSQAITETQELILGIQRHGSTVTEYLHIKVDVARTE